MAPTLLPLLPSAFAQLFNSGANESLLLLLLLPGAADGCC
jgi:hypothetical protein